MQLGDEDQAAAEELYSRPAWGHSDFLLHTQAANPQQSQLLLCAVHAAVLEAGLEPVWAQEVKCSCPLLTRGGGRPQTSQTTCTTLPDL